MERNFKIASPCTADWERMVGDDRVRHCSECNLNVYNFSAMTAADVETVVANHEGRLCARMYRRSDGTLLTQDCPVGLHAVLRLKVRRVSQVAGAALSAVMSVSLAAAQAAPQDQPSTVVQTKLQNTIFTLVVKDETGAVIPGANVTLVSASKRSMKSVTDERGRASLAHLEKGKYTVIVELRGFQTAERKVSLPKQGAVEAELTLSVGGILVGEVVEVPLETLKTHK